MARVRHRLPETRWPDAKEARAARLFQPGKLGPLRTRTRTWVPAMVPWRASEQGDVTEAVLDWYGRFARGRPGVLVVEATGIRDVPSGPLLRIGHDRFLPGLERLVRRVREESGGRTRLLIQILDFLRIRRRPRPERYFRDFLRLREEHRERFAACTGDGRWRDAAEGELREALLAAGEETWRAVLDEREHEALAYGERERVTDLHLEHVRELPRTLPPLFAAATRRAREAGFDGVELHFAHAYTAASFLSRRNTRSDGYGGDLAGRLRLPLEIAAASRAAVGTGFCLGARFLGDEVIAGGSPPEDAVPIGVALARAGLDFLSVSKGGKFEDARQPRIGEAAYPYTGRSGHECMPTVLSDERGPFGRNVGLAAAVRAGVRAAGLTTPVVTAGGIGTFELAEGILVRGEADFVAAARATLADPDWWWKTELGRGEEVRRCVYTNYCEGLDQRHKEVTCRLWDKQFRPDEAVSRSRDGRRRLVAPPWSRGPGADDPRPLR